MSDRCPAYPFFRDEKELQAKIDEYFNGGYRLREIRIGNSKDGYEMVKVPAITITDLVLFLGFASRQSFYDYEKNVKFAYTIKRARTFIEREYEEQLSLGNPTGAIFALKNFGWTDKTGIELSGNDGGPIQSINLSKEDWKKIHEDRLKNDDV